MRRVGFVLALAALAPTTPARAQSAYEQLQTFSAVLNHVRTNYVDTVETGTLVRASIEGMLRALDPHSYYVSRREFELRNRWDRGEVAGVGITLEEADGQPVVLGVIPRSPAEKAGIAPGDRIVRMGDSTVAGIGAKSLEARFFGEKGTQVRVTILRGIGPAADSFSVTLKRADLERRVVSPPRMIDSATGYVRLAEFTPDSPTELFDALGKIRGMGAKQLVLDLRANPGGSVPAMVEIASAFLPTRVEVFHTTGRKRTGYDSVTTDGNGKWSKIPLVVLVDRSSASAAEILAGTLQDHDRAVVVGRRTFGKALMQTALPLPGGDIVWLTTARIVTPSGRVLQRSYEGLKAEQYYDMGGATGAAADTGGAYRTSNGRVVRGGGGVTPDVVRDTPALPLWYLAAADSGFVTAVADSVAFGLPEGDAGRAAWKRAADSWDALLVTPFIDRVRARFRIAAEPEAALRQRIGRVLAARAAQVRWGNDAEDELVLAHDPDIRLALEQFGTLTRLLAQP